MKNLCDYKDNHKNNSVSEQKDDSSEISYKFSTDKAIIFLNSKMKKLY
jgi:hypothetical protein